ncbi:hypothetical protein ACFL6W_03655 [Thermodesulfobacteriota bacterium]
MLVAKITAGLVSLPLDINNKGVTMADWKDWAPFQTNKQKEVIENLSKDEKEELLKSAKTLGLKGAIYHSPALIIFFYLYAYTELSLTIKLLLSVSVFVILYVLFLIFVALPTRRKQKLLLNNSSYAQRNKIIV